MINWRGSLIRATDCFLFPNNDYAADNGTKRSPLQAAGCGGDKRPYQGDCRRDEERGDSDFLYGPSERKSGSYDRSGDGFGGGGKRTSKCAALCGEKIEITEEYRGQALFVYVKDDGAGFSPKALREADKAYFSENKEEDKAEGHFGIGLSVTKMLCEKHGGELKLFNSIEGGAVTAVSFFAGSGNL